MTITRTRTHTEVTFANPHLLCHECQQPVRAWHDNTACRCTEGFWLNPCHHKAAATSACPSWSPVDGCTCQPAHARLLDCGLCYEEQGEEVHPHPECTVGSRP